MGDTELQQVGRFVNEEPVPDSDMAGSSIPKMEFEEMGEFFVVEDSDRDRETRNFSQ